MQLFVPFVKKCIDWTIKKKKFCIFILNIPNYYYQKLNSMEKATVLESLEKIHSMPSKTDSSECTAPQWVFQKYKTGFVALDAPFQLFDMKHSVSVDEDSSDDNLKFRKERGPYRKYTLEEKMIAVQRIKNGEDVKQIAKEFGIPRRNLLRWKKNGCERKEGGGRPTDQEMERTLFAKIKNKEITGERQIRSQAIALTKSQSFKASKGWFLKFCKRFNISLSGDYLQMAC